MVIHIPIPNQLATGYYIPLRGSPSPYAQNKNLTSQIESIRWIQYTPLYEKGHFERESSQWRLL